MNPERSHETIIAGALCEVILGLEMTPRSPLGPTGATAGNDYADVADASAFTMMATATFFDDTREELGITGIDPDQNRVTFQTPLAYDHAAETVLSTNLLDYVPNVLGEYLVKGWPLIFVAPITSSKLWQTQRGLAGPIRYQIQYNVRDEQRIKVVHPNLWTKDQQHNAANALSAIIVAIARNPHIRVNAGPTAQGVGEQPSTKVADIAFGKYISRDDVPVFGAATVITIRPPRIRAGGA